jgi:nucleoside-diphosphate-sugar epimerase
MRKIIAITGANGFIGKELTRFLNTKGYTVKALVHQMPDQQLAGVEYILYDLANHPGAEIFKDVAVLIHLAFQFKKPLANEMDINISAAQFLKSLNIPEYIFISSFSATTHNPSYYGQCKLKLEELFANSCIVRPGLVVGKGGLIARLCVQLKKNSVVPLIAGGHQPFQTICITDFSQAIEKLIEQVQPGIIHLANPERISYKQLLQLIADHLHKKIYFIPVPVFAIRLIIWMTRKMQHPIVSQDNLDGLLHAVYVDTTEDLKRSGIYLRSTKEAIAYL